MKGKPSAARFQEFDRENEITSSFWNDCCLFLKSWLENDRVLSFQRSNASKVSCRRFSRHFEELFSTMWLRSTLYVNSKKYNRQRKDQKKNIRFRSEKEGEEEKMAFNKVTERHLLSSDIRVKMFWKKSHVWCNANARRYTYQACGRCSGRRLLTVRFLCVARVFAKVYRWHNIKLHSFRIVRRHSPQRTQML